MGKSKPNMALGSQGDLIPLLWSLPFPDTGYLPPAHLCLMPVSKARGDLGGPSQSQVWLDIQSHVAGIALGFPAVFHFSAEC